MNFKIIFHLDGCGVYFDPNEPIHLDGLLAWALSPMQKRNLHLGRDDEPDDIRIPLLETKINGLQIWNASALFPADNHIETLRYWRKRFRQNRCCLSNGSPNLTNGAYREYNMPIPLLLCRDMVAYASGNRKEVKKIFDRQLKYLGKKRSVGYGKILSIDYEEMEENHSLTRQGHAMRWLPLEGAMRLVRPRPPYWNNYGKVHCCEIGDEFICEHINKKVNKICQEIRF